MNRPTPAERAAAVRRTEEAASRRRNLYVVAAVAAVLALVVTIGVLVQGRRDTTGAAVDTVPSGVTAEHGVVVGEEDAERTVVIYEDFQCPACGLLESATSEAVRQGVADGTVKVEYRIVSFLDRASANAYSSRAANAALAVHEVAGADAFAAFHDALFAAQPEEGTAGPTNDELIEQAVKAGAGRAEVTPLIEDGTFDAWVVAATDAMSKAGVRSTPTAIIDGTPAADPTAELLAAVQ
ncbi:DsbA family protein [Nocardioides sp.]|uniref:DsbA family protein n=1 Tax=Nocardioides sp. TaxID=35761 RepID=UPI002C467855|nr:thioredoxin domain-containing protein [Nocardioides sp.]HSX68146.1 thioredoxin domain-containing protein [Nocardioides sp.]